MGELEPIVFIHGIFQMLRDLRAAEFFAPRPVLLPDMLGYGVPNDIPQDLSIPAQAENALSMTYAIMNSVRSP